jgi:hypothetical protein
MLLILGTDYAVYILTIPERLGIDPVKHGDED